MSDSSPKANQKKLVQANVVQKPANNLLETGKSSNSVPDKFSSCNELNVKPQKEQLQQLQHNGYILLKVNAKIRWGEGGQNIRQHKRILIPSSYTLMQLQSMLRKKYGLNEKQGLFFFIENQKIIQIRTTIKELAKKYQKAETQGEPYIQINAITAQKFGGQKFI